MSDDEQFDEAPQKEVTVVCVSEGCENFGVEICFMVPEDCVTFYCGPCGNQADASVSGSD